MAGLLVIHTNLVCVVLDCFDDNSQLGLTGAKAALPAWTDLLRVRLSLGQNWRQNFECPEGINSSRLTQRAVCISTLTCPNRQLIAITDRMAPNFECYNHGNLPDSDDFTRRHGNLPSTKPQLRAPAVRDAKNLFFHRIEYLESTRVDVDARGGGMLVNDSGSVVVQLC